MCGSCIFQHIKSCSCKFAAVATSDSGRLDRLFYSIKLVVAKTNFKNFARYSITFKSTTHASWNYHWTFARTEKLPNWSKSAGMPCQGQTCIPYTSSISQKRDSQNHGGFQWTAPPLCAKSRRGFWVQDMSMQWRCRLSNPEHGTIRIQTDCVPMYWRWARSDLIPNWHQKSYTCWCRERRLHPGDTWSRVIGSTETPAVNISTGFGR